MLRQLVAILVRQCKVRARTFAAALAASAICAAIFIWLTNDAGAVPVGTWHSDISQAKEKSIYNTENDSAQSTTTPKVEMEGIVLGKPFEPRNHTFTTQEAFASLGIALLNRFEARNVTIDHPECALNISRYLSSGIFSSSHYGETKERISIALNLRDSQSVLPSLSLALLEFITYLQPDHQIYVSVFESDSTDLTRILLGELASAILSLGVAGLTFRSSTLHRAETTERILSLSNLRNEALHPLLPFAADGIILFINDVITCGADLFELVHQLRLQDGHVSMSTDWQVWSEDPQFRDMWVARGINGDLTYPMSQPDGFSMAAPHGSWRDDFLVTQSESIYQRWLDGRPMPMYSGWNGAIAFRANLFTEYHIRFRASGQGIWRGGDEAGRLGEWGKLIAMPGYLESDCAASECELLARDIWNLLGGKAKFVLAPQSRMVYELHHWVVVSSQCPPVRRTEAEIEEDVELIDWRNVTMPAEVVCVPILNSTGQDTDPWGEGHMRFKLDPRFPAYQP